MSEHRITCPNCHSKETTSKVKIIPYSGHYVKYVPQAKLVCASCGRYLKFLSQDSEMIEKINQKLEELEL